MLLEKWYGDWVDDNGPHVVYQALLRLGPLQIGFDGGISLGGIDRTFFAMGRSSLPKIVDRTLRWVTPEGLFTWSGASPRAFSLWSAREDFVSWEPVALNGTVTGPRIRPGQRGYAERLILRVAPWAPGITTLRWGRFCGPRSSLVWIEWVGRIPVQLTLLDGRKVALKEVSPERVIVEGGTLKMRAAHLFVDAPLGSGILKDMPWPRRIKPLQFLAGVERKYVARGELALDGGAVEEGDVIFEEVLWP